MFLACAASSASAIRIATGTTCGVQGAVLDRLAERHAVDQLHDEIRLAVRFAEIVNRADIGMVQRRGRMRLPFETRPRVGVHLRALQHLDGDLPPQAQVARPIDLAHAALADEGDIS